MPDQFFSGIWGNYIVAEDTSAHMEVMLAKAKEKKNRIGTWINLQAEAPLSHGCPLGATTEEHDRP